MPVFFEFIFPTSIFVNRWRSFIEPTSPGNSRLYRLGVSQAQKAKESGDERPRLRVSKRTPPTFPSFPFPLALLDTNAAQLVLRDCFLILRNEIEAVFDFTQLTQLITWTQHITSLVSKIGCARVEFVLRKKSPKFDTRSDWCWFRMNRTRLSAINTDALSNFYLELYYSLVEP